MKNLIGIRSALAAFIVLWLSSSAYAQTQSDQPKQVLSEHADTITAIAFASDGQTLASISQDGMLILWNTRTGEIKRKLQSEDEVFRSVAFSPDGRSLATGSANRNTRERESRNGWLTLWDARTGEVRRKMRVGPTLSLESQPGWVLSVAFSPDGKIVVGAIASGEIRIWDAQTGKDIRSLSQHQRAINSLAFSTDGRILASAGNDELLVLWDTQTWKTRQKLKMKETQVRSVAFAPDGKTVVSASTLVTKRVSPTIVTSDMTSNGDNVVAVSGYRLRPAGSEVKLWDVETGKMKLDLASSRAIVLAVAFSPDGKTVANAVVDKTVRLVTISNGEFHTLRGHDEPVVAISFSPDGKTLASGGADKKIRLWDITDLKMAQ